MATKAVNTSAATSEESPSLLGGLLGNTKVLIGIGLVLLLAVGAFVYLRNQNEKNNEAARIELARIRGAYDKGEYSKAIYGDTAKRIGTEKVRGLQAIVDDYGGTQCGALAALYLGNSYMVLGQVDKASDCYQKAMKHDYPVIQAGAHAGMAAVAEARSKYEEAGQEYITAADLDNTEVTVPDYLLHAARAFEKANKREDAVNSYRKVATKYPESLANVAAREALAGYNVEL